MKKKKTMKDFGAMKNKGEKITMLTVYDAAMAHLLEASDVDILLVGDSLGNVVLGYDSTVPVTMEEMLHHCAAVRRGAPRSFIVGDMPFGSYQVDMKSGLENGIRLIKESGVDAVKLEGGIERCDMISALVKAGIPVMAHIGLTPQTAGQLGGYKVQGKDDASARKLYKEIIALENAGAFAVVMECVPANLAKLLTETVSIPTVGIGAGPHCDGQVLVINDMLGISHGHVPKFVKKYENLASPIQAAVSRYISEVKDTTYPTESHSFTSETDYSGLDLD